MDTLPANCLVLRKTGNAAVTAMFAEAAPGDEIEVTLKNGVSTVDLKFCIDENLTDRVSGQLVDEDAEEAYEAGKEPGNVPAEADRNVMPADGVGASVLAVMGRPK